MCLLMYISGAIEFIPNSLLFSFQQPMYCFGTSLLRARLISAHGIERDERIETSYRCQEYINDCMWEGLISAVEWDKVDA